MKAIPKIPSRSHDTVQVANSTSDTPSPIIEIKSTPNLWNNSIIGTQTKIAGNMLLNNQDEMLDKSLQKPRPNSISLSIKSSSAPSPGSLLWENESLSVLKSRRRKIEYQTMLNSNTREEAKSFLLAIACSNNIIANITSVLVTKETQKTGAMTISGIAINGHTSTTIILENVLTTTRPRDSRLVRITSGRIDCASSLTDGTLSL